MSLLGSNKYNLTVLVFANVLVVQLDELCADLSVHRVKTLQLSEHHRFYGDVCLTGSSVLCVCR